MQQDHKSDRGGSQDELDRLLDGALAQYAAVEPRPGMEDRVLATLRAEAARPARRAWWRWSVAAAVAATLVIAISLAFHKDQPSGPTMVKQVPENALPQPRHNDETFKKSSRSVHDQRPARPHSRPVTAEAAVNPVLDLFPSPRPLSEQEKALETFIHQYPRDAALIAEARMESLRRDQEERQAQLADDENSK